MQDPFEICKEWLTNEGINYEIDGDGDILLRYMMAYIYIINPKKDAMFLQVMLPNFWSIKSEQEYLNALNACNNVNMQQKWVRCFATKENVCLIADLLIDEISDLVLFMGRVFNKLLLTRQLFAEEMRKLQTNIVSS